MSLFPSRKIHFFLYLRSSDVHAFICTRYSFICVTTKYAKLFNAVPNIMKDVTELKESLYNLPSESTHFTRRNGTYYSLLSIKDLASQIWKIVPKFPKFKTLTEFKTRIKSWCPDHVRVGSAKPIQHNQVSLEAYIHLFMAEPVFTLLPPQYIYSML